MKTKILHRDKQRNGQPKGTHYHAKNIVVTHKRDAITNELGFSEIIDTTNRHIGKIPLENDETVIFELSSNSLEDTQSEIALVTKEGTKTTILLDAALGFTVYHPIKGVFLKNYKGDRIIAWTDNINPPRILNIDDTGLNLTSGKAFVDAADVDLLRMFPEFEVPQMNFTVANDSGGQLKSGVYYFSTSYEFPDGSTTNWSRVVGPIHITEDNSGDGFYEYDGIDSDSATSKAISINFTDIDQRYKYLRIAAIPKIGGTTTAKLIKKYYIEASNFTYKYTGGESFTDLVLDEVLVDKISYKTSKTLTYHNNRLYLANLTTETPINWQKYANNVKVKWLYEDYISLDDTRGSHKDEITIINRKGFMPDEVYALYAAFLLPDGTFSPAFHIPGRAAGTTSVSDGVTTEVVTETDLISTVITQNPTFFDYLNHDATIDPNVRFFQTQPTCKQNGDLSFWRNENEYYPNTSDWDIVDSNESTIGTLQGTNVRHHKMPSLRYLHADSTTDAFIEPDPFSTGGTQLFNVDFDATVNTTGTGTVTEEPNFTETLNSDTPAGSYALNVVMSNGNRTYVSILLHTVVISGTWTLSAQAQDTPPGNAAAQVYVIFKVYDDNGFLIRTVVDQIRQHTAIEGETATAILTGSVGPVTIQMPQDYYMEWEIFGEAIGDVTNQEIVNLTANFDVTGYEYDPNFDIVVNGTKFSRVIGLRFEEIYVPDSIKSQVLGIEFFYAKRTDSNLSIAGQSLLMLGADHPLDDTKVGTYAGMFLQDMGYAPIREYIRDQHLRFHAFDLLKDKPAIAPTHITLQVALAAKIVKGEDGAGNAQYADLDPANRKASFYIDLLSDYTRDNAVDPIEIDKALRKITNFQYVPADTAAVNGIENTYAEECMTATVNHLIAEQAHPGCGNFEWMVLNVDVGFYDVDNSGLLTGISSGAIEHHLTNLCIYRTEMYSAFTDQELVSTNSVILFDDYKNVYTSLKTYGGDVFLSPYGLRFTAPFSHSDDGTTTAYETAAASEVVSFIHYFPCYSAANIGLRHEGLGDEGKYFPKSTGHPDDYTTNAEWDVMNEYLLLPGDSASTNQFNYNDDYTSINDIGGGLALPFNSNVITISQYPHRIVRSVVFQSEDKALTLRTFLANDEYELVKDKGSITDIQSFSNQIIILTEFSIFRTIGNETIDTSTTAATLGTGDIFRLPPDEVRPTKEGYAGGQHLSPIMLCKLGYFFVDSKQGKVFLLSDTLEEISSYGMRTYFCDELPFKLVAQLMTDNSDDFLATDVPFAPIGAGYNSAFDEKYDRLLLTKRDWELKTGETYTKDPADIQILANDTLVLQDGQFYIVDDAAAGGNSPSEPNPGGNFGTDVVPNQVGASPPGEPDITDSGAYSPGAIPY